MNRDKLIWALDTKKKFLENKIGDEKYADEIIISFVEEATKFLDNYNRTQTLRQRNG
jgi:hypothetical protein